MICLLLSNILTIAAWYCYKYLSYLINVRFSMKLPRIGRLVNNFFAQTYYRIILTYYVSTKCFRY